VLTDDAGRFAFTRLPAGTYTVTARKAAYLAAPYGARRPGRSGMPVALKDGQRTNLTITMFRGAVITGVIRDAAGLPVRGVDVRAIDARTLLTMPDASPIELARTDDRGVFRMYSLLPGDYFVVALPMPGGSGEIVAPSTASNDSALATLAARRAMSAGPLGATAAPTPLPSPPPIGFSPVYYPGTSSHTGAVPVHVEPGAERAGVDFELRPVPMAAIEGVVSGDVANLAAVQVTIIPSGPPVTTMMSSNSLSGRPIDAQGRFRYSNLPPGSYRLVARGRRGDSGPSGVPTTGSSVAVSRGGVISSSDTQRPATGDYLYGVADVELRGEDVMGVPLVLNPAARSPAASPLQDRAQHPGPSI
jgi:hypothetical protein